MFSLLFRLFSLTGAFLYPAYASYKTLSKRPASEIDLERWLMYWSVLGVILAAEYTAEWLVRWIPLYSLFKMVFLLYLAAPQTEGSTYIYKVYMNPFLNQHEDEIDRTIGEIKVRIFAYAQAKLRAAWDALYGALLSQATSQQAQAQSGPPQPGAGAPVAGDAPPPSMMDPMSGPAKMAWGLWQSYGPTVVARGATLLAVASAAAQNGAAQAQAQAQGRSANAEPPSISRSSSSSSSVPRRADEGVELATISPSAALAAHSRTISQQSLQAGGVESAMKGSLYLPADAPEDSNGRYEQIDHDELNEDDPLLSPQSASTAVSGGGGWFGGWGKPAEKTKTE